MDTSQQELEHAKWLLSLALELAENKDKRIKELEAIVNGMCRMQQKRKVPSRRTATLPRTHARGTMQRTCKGDRH